MSGNGIVIFALKVLGQGIGMVLVLIQNGTTQILTIMKEGFLDLFLHIFLLITLVNMLVVRLMVTECFVEDIGTLEIFLEYFLHI